MNRNYQRNRRNTCINRVDGGLLRSTVIEDQEIRDFLVLARSRERPELAECVVEHVLVIREVLQGGVYA